MSDDYLDILEKDTWNMVAAAKKGELPEVLFREEQVEQVLSLLQRRRSVLVVGPPGVGKTAVIHGVAQRIAASHPPEDGEWPEEFVGPVWLAEISCASLMSRTRYLGEWQTKVGALVQRSREVGAAIYFSDVWNLTQAGITSKTNDSVFESLKPDIDAGRFVIVGEATPAQARAMERTPGFTQMFQVVLVDQLEEEKAMEVISNRATMMGMRVDPPCLKTLMRLPMRFSPARPPPGGSIALLENVRDYHEEKARVGEPEVTTPGFIEKVYSIYSGLPLFIVSEGATKPAGEIRAWFQERLVGQRQAIDAVVESIALFKAGLQDPNKPLGTFLFVGPTGVGKTELARLLATFLFGSVNRMLRFDLSEFSEYHAVTRLIGSPNNPNQPAELIDPVRANPFQVILFDELEKAHNHVWDLLLPLLDEGRLTPPTGGTVDFRNTIVICTSNVGAISSSERIVGFGKSGGKDDRSERVQEALEEAFRPEFLNRFQHVTVFHPLERDQVRTVARQELKRIMAREGITGRNLVVDVQENAFDLVIDRGFDPRYGARALKRELQRQLVMPLAMTMMEKAPPPGSLLQISTRGDRIRVRVIDTPESREHEQEQEPIRTEGGQKLSRDDIAQLLSTVATTLDGISGELDEPALAKRQKYLENFRRQPGFYRDAQFAQQCTLELDQLNRRLDRLDRLRDRLLDIEEKFGDADSRERIARVGQRIEHLHRDVENAGRELVVMGEEGFWDAIVEISMVGGDAEMARDVLVETYVRWAKKRGFKLTWLTVPTDPNEPVVWSVCGHYAYGLLKGESGLHRVRRGEDHSTARVRVIPWTDVALEERVRYTEHRAIKGSGQYGQKLRSRLALEGGLVLQNGNTLGENQELANQVMASWRAASAPSDTIVRRYDLDPFKMRDTITGVTSGRSDALHAEAFHELLQRRVEALGSGASQAADTEED